MSVDLPIKEFMQRDLLECDPSMSVRQAPARMHDARCGSILIVDEGKALDIWTETDALSNAFHSEDDLDLPVSAFMISPVQSIPA